MNWIELNIVHQINFYSGFLCAESHCIESFVSGPSFIIQLQWFNKMQPNSWHFDCSCTDLPYRIALVIIEYWCRSFAERPWIPWYSYEVINVTVVLVCVEYNFFTHYLKRSRHVITVYHIHGIMQATWQTLVLQLIRI